MEGRYPSTIKYPKTFEASLPLGHDGIFDWSFLLPIFEGTRIKPTDIDCLVERCGQILIIETKHPGTDIPDGQRIALETLISLGRGSICVMVLYGKLATDIVALEEWYGDKKGGCHKLPRKDCDYEYVIQRVTDWWLWANKQESAQGIVMTNTWKDLDSEQLSAAPPSTCKYCGEPIYFESLAKGKAQPVDAAGFKRHYCLRGKAKTEPKAQEVEVPEEQAQMFETPAERRAPPLSKTEAHIQYKLANGTPVPGVTTILGILNKPYLVHWAWELGRQNLDYREVRDTAGDAGTLAHYLIMCLLKGELPDTSEYSSVDIQKAKNSLAKFKNWLKEHPSLKPIMIEAALVSEEFRFGGTLDLFAELDGEFVLVDFKTSKAIYPDMLYQLAAYRKLLEEQGWPVASARILRIGRDEDEGFEERIKTNLETEWDIFWHCLCIYRIRQAVR